MSIAGVSTENCSTVIRIVAKSVFNKQINEKLPCGQTCLNIALEGQVISIQRVEHILNAESVAIHSDGTSMDHKKINKPSGYYW